MSRIAYVGGRYVPHRAAVTHIEDRGYQFADGIYEVIAFRNGRLVDEARHFDRLRRSLAELQIAPPMSAAALRLVVAEVIRRNDLGEGSLYMQVTRGIAPRDHAFPKSAKPQLVITVRRPRPIAASVTERGVRVVTAPDERWARCDIKSIALLPNVLAKQRAREAGAYEAWLTDEDGNVTEGSSSNAWIVTAAGDLVTRRAGANILNGVTRLDVIDEAQSGGVRLVERPFNVAEARAAREAFLTSTTVGVLPVTQIDGQVIGNGRPGTVTLRLRDRLAASQAAQVG